MNEKELEELKKELLEKNAKEIVENAYEQHHESYEDFLDYFEGKMQNVEGLEFSKDESFSVGVKLYEIMNYIYDYPGRKDTEGMECLVREHYDDEVADEIEFNYLGDNLGMTLMENSQYILSLADDEKVEAFINKNIEYLSNSAWICEYVFGSITEENIKVEFIKKMIQEDYYTAAPEGLIYSMSALNKPEVIDNIFQYCIEVNDEYIIPAVLKAMKDSIEIDLKLIQDKDENNVNYKRLKLIEKYSENKLDVHCFTLNRIEDEKEKVKAYELIKDELDEQERKDVLTSVFLEQDDYYKGDKLKIHNLELLSEEDIELLSNIQEERNKKEKGKVEKLIEEKKELTKKEILIQELKTKIKENEDLKQEKDDLMTELHNLREQQTK